MEAILRPAASWISKDSECSMMRRGAGSRRLASISCKQFVDADFESFDFACKCGRPLRMGGAFANGFVERLEPRMLDF